MKIGIIVLNFEKVEATLKLLLDCTSFDSDNHITILVDNGSSVESITKITGGIDDNVNTIINAHNFGYAKGNNIGMEYAFSVGCDWALILNNDIEINNRNFINDFIEFVIQFNIHDGLVAPIVEDVRGIDLTRRTGLHSLFSSNISTIYGNNMKTKSNAIHIPGCSFFISRKAFFATEGFDERFFMYGEENDLCLRTAKFGYPIVQIDRNIVSQFPVAAGLSVVHNHHSKDAPLWVHFLDERNRSLQISKYGLLNYLLFSIFSELSCWKRLLELIVRKQTAVGVSGLAGYYFGRSQLLLETIFKVKIDWLGQARIIARNEHWSMRLINKIFIRY